MAKAVFGVAKSESQAISIADKLYEVRASFRHAKLDRPQLC
jgi:hypothetical protein